MFLWVRVVQLLPEAQEVREVQGNQEHQRYQERPTHTHTQTEEFIHFTVSKYLTIELITDQPC